MSYLNGPRINFWGGASTNVDTANNGNRGTLKLFDFVSATVKSPESDDALIAQLRGPTPGHDDSFVEAGWNYYGDHQVAFLDARVSSEGEPGAVKTDGDLHGLPVYLLGSVDPQSGDGPYGGPVMVDLDPTSGQTTQIFVGGLQVGGQGGADPKLLLRADTRCHSRLIGTRYDSSTTAPPFSTPGSVYASATFQVAFPKEAVVQADRSVPIVEAILDAPGAVGIVLRFSFFEFMPGLDSAQIQQGYKDNENPENPSLGRVIGTIGPWFEGEPATCPPGRLLDNAGLGAQGLAFLDPEQQRLTLDLVGALQGKAIRQDSTDNTSPIGPNVDYGDLLISVNQDGIATPTPARTPSLPDTYYLFGGLYDIDLDEQTTEALERAPIQVGSTQNGLRIEETPLRIYGDPRNVYLGDVSGKGTLELAIRELGGPVRQETTVTLATSKSGIEPDPAFLDFPAQVTVPKGSDSMRVEVGLKAGAQPGFLALDLTSGDASYYVNFRKYPDDDFSDLIAAGNIPWDTVYEECLRYYYVIFPAMSKRIPLNDQATLAAVAGEILKRISTEYLPTTLYMPLTRSMSPGRVALLWAWLKEQQKGG